MSRTFDSAGGRHGAGAVRNRMSSVAQQVASRTAALALLLSRVSAALTVAIGLLALSSWLLGVPFLRRPVPTLPPMMPASAISTVILGSGLLVLTEGGPRRRRTCLIVWGGCAVVALVAVAMLAQVFALMVGAGEPVMGIARTVRPSLPAALGFLLLACAILTLDVATWCRLRLAEALALAGVVPSLVAFSGYVYGATVLYGSPAPAPSIGMSPQAALAQILLALGVLCARPESGLVSALTSDLEGGRMARRLLLGVLAVPALGLAILAGQAAGLYPHSHAMALLAIVAFVVILAALLVVASQLNRADAERRAGELERAQLASIVLSSDDTIIATDLEGRVIHWNPAAERQYGHSAKEMLGRHISAIVPPDRRHELDQIWEVVKAGGHLESFETVRQRKDGSLFEISLTLSPIVDATGRMIGVSGIGRDIRQRRAAESELHRAHESELAAFRELERLREEWATVVAHDLRQPLTSITLSLDLMRSLQAQRTPSAQEARCLQRIGTAARGLRRMIDDLSDASRIEARRLTLEPSEIDLGRVVRDACEQVGDRCLCRVETNGRTAWADPERITQVVANLLTNAIKYGAPDEPVGVVVTGNDSELEVSVTNRGPGIPPEEVPELFDRFKRARAVRDARTEGLGLGLYICRGLVEAHGGRIWAESTLGATTTFHFTLPCATPRTEHREQPSASS